MHNFVVKTKEIQESNTMQLRIACCYTFSAFITAI